MSYHKFYFLVSIAIGVFQIIDGVLLFSLSDISSFSLVFSISEMLWVIFSIVAIFKVKNSRYVPITYTAYNVFGWAYGVYLVMNSHNPQELVISTWIGVLGLCFGCYFAMASYFTLRKHGINKA